MAKTAVLVTVVLLSILTVTNAWPWKAVLLSKNEFNPPATGANSQALFTLKIDTSKLIGYYTLDISNTGSGVIMAHIHKGNSTTNGFPGVQLVPAATNPSIAALPQLNPPIVISKGSIKGSFSLANFFATVYPQTKAGWALFMVDLKAGNLYVNIHTVDFPAGVARGQIVHK